MALVTRQEVSAGGVVVTRDGAEWHVALIARNHRTIWCLPKGHIEPGETPEQAALREVREETGFTAEILQRLGELSYWFVSRVEQVRVFKTVHFYLMRFVMGSPDDHDLEVEEVRWFSLHEADRRMNYPSERALVRQAERWLASAR